MTIIDLRDAHDWRATNVSLLALSWFLRKLLYLIERAAILKEKEREKRKRTYAMKRCDFETFPNSRIRFPF